MFLLIFYLTLALFVSFLCSLLEASLLSITHGHISLLLEKKKGFAQILKNQKESINKPLTAILTLNTIAHTIGAAGVGAQVASLYGDNLVVAASVVLTLLILFLSEILPKTLGAYYCKELARFTALTTWVLVKITLPLVKFVELFARSKKAFSVISRDEIQALSRLAVKHGSLTFDESLIIRNLFALRSIKVKDIMTPQDVVFTLPASMTIKQVIDDHHTLPFTRIPIYQDEKEKIVGFVLRHDLFMAYRDQKENESLLHLVQPALFINEDADIAYFLSESFKKNQHMFLATKNDRMSGLVTLEDAIETLLGVEIVDETDTIVDMRELSKRLQNRRRVR